MYIFLKYLIFTGFFIALAFGFWGLFRHSWLHRKILGGEWKKVTEHAGNEFGFSYTFWVRLKKENLPTAGEQADSVDEYAKKYNFAIPTGSTHNPLYDCEVAAKVFFHLNKS